MSHSVTFLEETERIAQLLHPDYIEIMVARLAALRDRKGRLFIIGLGGSHANAQHFAADLRKLCHIEAYSFDNVAELTARANDEGWETIFHNEWARPEDALFVLSVGGGTETVSKPIVEAINAFKGHIFAILGRDGGLTAKAATTSIIIPTVNSARVTPHVEAFQAVIWHCIVSHPDLQRSATKW